MRIDSGIDTLEQLVVSGGATATVAIFHGPSALSYLGPSYIAGGNNWIITKNLNRNGYCNAANWMFRILEMNRIES